MKKLAQIVYKLMLGICVVAMTVFYTLAYAIVTPFRTAQYRKSHFARDTGAEYEDGVLKSPVFDLYNRLRSAGTPVEAVAHPKEPKDAHLLWHDTLIIHEIDRVALRGGRWVIGPGSPVWKEGLPLEDAIAEVLADVADDRPGFRPGNTVLLLDRTSISPEDRLEAELMPLFLLCDGEDGRFEILKKYCK